MKKTFTFIAVVTLMSSNVFAQYNNNSNNDNNYGNNNYGNPPQAEAVVVNDYKHYNNHHNFYGERENNIEIDRIKYRSDLKIAHVVNSYFMGRD